MYIFRTLTLFMFETVNLQTTLKICISVKPRTVALGVPHSSTSFVILYLELLL